MAQKQRMTSIYAAAQLSRIDPKTLVGKTIMEVDDSSCNVLLIRFLDGMEVAVEGHHDFQGSDFFSVQEMISCEL